MEMSLTELRNLLDRIIAAEAWDFPLFIWGGPGIGKSAVIKDVCEARGLELCDIRVGHMDVVDFRGVPEIRTQGDRRVTTWAMPDFLPQTEGPGISVLEELPSAPPLVQLPTYQYVWDRRIGEYVLPEKWLIVATGNRLQDRGVYFSLPRPIASRFAMHITINVSQQEWDKWAMAHDINVYVRAYLKFRPNMLNVDPDPKSKEHAFPCPRTWEYVSRLIGMYRNVQELVCWLSSPAPPWATGPRRRASSSGGRPGTGQRVGAVRGGVGAIVPHDIGQHGRGPDVPESASDRVQRHGDL
jgi:hypothetical protein